MHVSSPLYSRKFSSKHIYYLLLFRCNRQFTCNFERLVLGCIADDVEGWHYQVLKSLLHTATAVIELGQTFFLCRRTRDSTLTSSRGRSLAMRQWRISRPPAAATPTRTRSCTFRRPPFFLAWCAELIFTSASCERRESKSDPWRVFVNENPLKLKNCRKIDFLSYSYQL